MGDNATDRVLKRVLEKDCPEGRLEITLTLIDSLTEKNGEELSWRAGAQGEVFESTTAKRTISGLVSKLVDAKRAVEKAKREAEKTQLKAEREAARAARIERLNQRLADRQRQIVATEPPEGPVSKRKYLVRCKEGHEVWITRGSLMKAYGCGECFKTVSTLQTGDRVGRFVYLGREGSEHRVRCECGNEDLLKHSALQTRIREDSRCYKCRFDIVEIECTKGCGTKIRRPVNVAPQGVCESCRRENIKETHGKSMARRVVATLGRVCIGCGRGDHQTRWSQNKNYCSACDRMRWRNGTCSSCAAPLTKQSTPRGKLACKAKCGASNH